MSVTYKNIFDVIHQSLPETDAEMAYWRDVENPLHVSYYAAIGGTLTALMTGYLVGTTSEDMNRRIIDVLEKMASEGDGLVVELLELGILDGFLIDERFLKNYFPKLGKMAQKVFLGRRKDLNLD